MEQPPAEKLGTWGFMKGILGQMLFRGAGRIMGVNEGMDGGGMSDPQMQGYMREHPILSGIILTGAALAQHFIPPFAQMGVGLIMNGFMGGGQGEIGAAEA